MCALICNWNNYIKKIKINYPTSLLPPHSYLSSITHMHIVLRIGHWPDQSQLCPFDKCSDFQTTVTHFSGCLITDISSHIQIPMLNTCSHGWRHLSESIVNIRSPSKFISNLKSKLQLKSQLHMHSVKCSCPDIP